MVPRPLGKTGILVSPIGLGTVKIGRNTGVKYAKGFDVPADSEVAALLNRALELGVNVIDTAPAYGTSEVRLQAFVRAHRKDIVLVTKCGESFENGVSRWDFTAKAMVDQVQASLRRLGTERVDLLLLHSDGRDEELLANPEVMRMLKEARKWTRAVGISAKTDAGIRAAITRLDVVMAPFNQADQSLAPALEAAHAAGLGVMAIKAVEQGKSTTPEDAIAFAVGRPFIDCVVLGTLSPAHLESAVRVAEKSLRQPPSLPLS